MRRLGGSGGVSAAEATVRAAQDLGPGKDLPSLEVNWWSHGGFDVRGVGATDRAEIGQPLLTVPRSQRGGSTEAAAAGPRFKQPEGADKWDYVSTGLWLAEKRAMLAKRSYESLSPSDKVWAAYVKSLPSLEEYQKHGIPIATPDADLMRLARLPAVGKYARNTLSTKEYIASAVERYNAASGSHPKLKNEDADWGVIAAITRTFLCGGTTFAPGLGDLFNHADERTANAFFQCNKKNHTLTFTAKKAILPGDEVTVSYHGNDHDALSVLFQYGALNETAKATFPQWSAKTCASLKAAKLYNGGPLLKQISKLTDLSCPDVSSPVVVARMPVEVALLQRCLVHMPVRAVKAHGKHLSQRAMNFL